MKSDLGGRYLVIVSAILLSGQAMSAEESGPWSGKAALGYLASSGNSENSSINANFKLSYDLDSWHHSFNALAIGDVNDSVTTGERYKAGFKSKYDLSEHNYVFGLLNWEKDRFSGYKQQTSETIGYGRRLLKTDVHTLNLELGVGAKQADLSDGTTSSGTIAFGGMDYEWKFSDSASFTQLLAVESGSGNTYIESVSAVSAKLLGSLSLGLSYTIKNNSDVPTGRDRTDTYTAINLEYGF